MIMNPEITQIAPQSIAALHLTIPRNEIQSVMGPGIGEVMAAVSAQGCGPAGPWFTHHLKMEPATFDFEICVPITAPFVPAGRVTGGEWPAMKAARTVYQGPYEGLGEAWGEFGGWVTANGHEPRPDLYERYLVGPESSPNPADWRTELIRPLTDS